jgi:hypothetical protein
VASFFVFMFRRIYGLGCPGGADGREAFRPEVLTSLWLVNHLTSERVAPRAERASCIAYASASRRRRQRSSAGRVGRSRCEPCGSERGYAFDAAAVAELSAECAHDLDDSETPMSGLRALSL